MLACSWITLSHKAHFWSVNFQSRTQRRQAVNCWEVQLEFDNSWTIDCYYYCWKKYWRASIVCLWFNKLFGIFVVKKNCCLNCENKFSYVIFVEVCKFFVEVGILFLFFLWYTFVWLYHQLQIYVRPSVRFNIIYKPYQIRNVKSAKIYLGKPQMIDLHKLKTMNKCFQNR